MSSPPTYETGAESSELLAPSAGAGAILSSEEDAPPSVILKTASSSSLSSRLLHGKSSTLTASPALTSRQKRLSTIPKFSTALAHDDNEENIEQKQGAVVLAKLPANGFNRIKTLWAKRESTAGFSSPLSTWSRNYAASNRKLHSEDEQGGGSSRVLSGKSGFNTISGRYDPDKLATSVEYLNFGKPITQVPRIKLDQYEEEIPLVLISLRDELENSGGFHVEGVFRVAASMDDQRQIKGEMDIGKYSGCKSVDDSMCVASLIKEWFRTLAPTRILNHLPLESVKMGESEISKELSEPFLSVYLWLIDLMADVCKLEYINRMSPRAMAIVIAPNLYDAANATSPQDIIQEMNGATQIVENSLRACLAARKEEGRGGGGVAAAIRNKETGGGTRSNSVSTTQATARTKKLSGDLTEREEE